MKIGDIITMSGPTRVTGPDGAVVMSSANGLVGTGFASRNPEQVFKDPMCRPLHPLLSH